jgi:hypothetical protein
MADGTCDISAIAPESVGIRYVSQDLATYVDIPGFFKQRRELVNQS